jgi:cell division protein FtsZ
MMIGFCKKEMNKMGNQRNKVFISYSHRDRDWLDRLSIHLKPLIRDNSIELWDDTKIVVGSKWKDEIQKAINESSIAILLISANFLASDFITQNELPPLLEKAQSDGVIILPLIVSPCRFIQTKSISQFQAINDPTKPLIGVSLVDQENILLDVTKAVDAALAHFSKVNIQIIADKSRNSIDEKSNENIHLRDAVIKVFGVGGGGCNTVQYMAKSNVTGVELIAANTDNQALRGLSGVTRLQIGIQTTRGLGAGGKLEVGNKAAIEATEQIIEKIRGADLLFITAGMGGGTGTGAISAVAQIARKMNILTIAVVTKPFYFEGKIRMVTAERGISELIKHVDSLIVLPNDNLYKCVDSKETLQQGFNRVNDVLRGAVQGIYELLTLPGLVNVDFADMQTVMQEKGFAKLGMGTSNAVSNRAKLAAESAINNPLTIELLPRQNQFVLANITGGPNMSLSEFNEAGECIKNNFSDDATMIIGASINPNLVNEVQVTVIATGFEIN